MQDFSGTEAGARAQTVFEQGTANKDLISQLLAQKNQINAQPIDFVGIKSFDQNPIQIGLREIGNYFMVGLFENTNNQHSPIGYIILDKGPLKDAGTSLTCGNSRGLKNTLAENKYGVFLNDQHFKLFFSDEKWKGGSGISTDYGPKASDLLFTGVNRGRGFGKQLIEIGLGIAIKTGKVTLFIADAITPTKKTVDSLIREGKIERIGLDIPHTGTSAVDINVKPGPNFTFK